MGQQVRPSSGRRHYFARYVNPLDGILMSQLQDPICPRESCRHQSLLCGRQGIALTVVEVNIDWQLPFVKVEA